MQKRGELVFSVRSYTPLFANQLFPAKNLLLFLKLMQLANAIYKNNYIPTIFLTVFAVLIVNLLLIFALAVLDHQFVFW